jgi:hypothetical protein
MSEKTASPGLSTMLIGTTTEPDQVSDDHVAVFKQELRLEVTLMLALSVGDHADSATEHRHLMSMNA